MYVRRACFVLAVALAALAPDRAPAAQVASGNPTRWAALLGVEDGPGDAGLQLRGDLEFAQRPLSPTIGFSIVGSAGFTRFSESGGAYDYVYGYDTSWDWSLNLFKFSGAARFSFGHSPTLRPYVDAGLGLYYASLSGNETVYVGYPYYYAAQSYSDSDVGLFLRLAAGLTFQVSPNFALGAELGFNPYFGDMPDDTLTSLLASATFRM